MTETHMNGHIPWLKWSRWFFVAASSIAAIVALAAEPANNPLEIAVGVGLIGVCIATISAWSLFNVPGVGLAAMLTGVALIALGWSVEDPESALFQSVLIATAVGWRIHRLSRSLALLLLLTMVPVIGTLGPNDTDWGWWNWSMGTVLTWCIGRIVRSLELTLEQLVSARAQLVDSAARAERLRISRDIHDLVGHSLTAMLLNIRAAQRALPGDHQNAEAALADAEQIGTTGLTDIRAALADMRYDQTCGDRQHALSSLPDGEDILLLLEKQHHIATDTSGDIQALQGPAAVAVYRIAQECITNISKYATPETAAIQLTVKANEIVLESSNEVKSGHIADDSLSENSLGLIGMRERASSLGGEFRTNTDKKLWQIYCRIPNHD